MKIYRILTLVFIFFLISGGTVLARNQGQAVLSPQPAAITHAAQNLPQLSGFPLVLGSSESYMYESPTTLADINNDGKLEIIVGGRTLNANGSLGCNGMVYVIKSDGTFLWKKMVRADVNAGITAYDLNGDGIKDLVVPMGAWNADGEDGGSECGKGNPNAAGNGGVVALDGRNGNEIWTFNTGDWGEWMAGPNGVLDGVYSTPAVGDVDGDGNPEIVFGGWDDCIYMLDRFGNSLWGKTPFNYDPKFCGQHGFFNHDTVYSSPVLADLNHDGKLEIIIGGDVSCTNPNVPALCNAYMEPNGGFVWVIRYDGVPLARKWFDQAIHSSPAVADLNNDGVLEIVANTGIGFPGKGYYVTAMHFDPTLPLTAALVTNWQTSVVGRVESSPAIADLNGDGVLDVVSIAMVGDWGIPVGPNANHGSYIYALSGNDGHELWKTHACNNDSIGRSFPIHTSPIVADITGNSRPEVLFPMAWEIGILNSDGTYYSKVNTGSGCTSSSGIQLFSGSGSFSASPAVGDLNGDGKVEIVAAGWYNEGSTNRGVIQVWDTQHTAAAPYWPMFHHDAAHTGTIPLPPHQVVAPNQVLALHDVNDDNNMHITVQLVNNGGGAYNWTATAPAGITIVPSSGSVTTSATVVIAIPSSQYGSIGTYNLGSISFKATSVGGGIIINGNANVPVQLRVAELSSVYLPVVKR